LGNEVVSIIGARSKDLLVWEDRMRKVSDELIVTTDDGSYGRKGVVTEPLKELLDKKRGQISKVLAVGPAIMMKFVALTTKPYSVKTIVSLNPIMVDGSGMCGACRVEVGGKTRFACVDGPEFDGHEVNFDLFFRRLNTYREEEVAKQIFLEVAE
jgi:ferredoxin--NADP+ reductase